MMTMSPFFAVLLTFIAVTQASGPSCGDVGHTCYYINDPCPAGTEDCSAQYSCSVETNKCCCKTTTSCPQDWVAHGSLCYYVITSPDVQEPITARKQCQDLGADLPVIKSAEENDFFFNLIKDKGQTWLGMNSKGDNDFYWVDGTSVADTFSAWNTGEPNNIGLEDCVYMYVDEERKGKWNNDRCYKERAVICQKHI